MSTLRNNYQLTGTYLSDYELTEDGQPTLISPSKQASLTFIPLSTFRATGIDLYLGSSVSKNQNVGVGIYGTDGNKKPTGAALYIRSAYVAAGSSAQWYTTSGTGPPDYILASGVTYCLVLKVTSAYGDAARAIADKGGYTGEYFHRSVDSGTTWSDSSIVDLAFAFRIYGQEPEPLKPTIITPSDGSISQPTNVSLFWNIMETWTHTVDVYLNGSIVVSDSADTGVYIQPSYLDINTEYEWRVDTRNAFGFVTTGDTWSFTTGAAIPISTPAELQDINDNLSAEYYLVNDIDLTGATWTPIGDETNQFAGGLDGMGFTISNLTIDNDVNAYTGLFGVTNGATLHDIHLTNISITIKRFYVGGLVGSGGGGTIITDCDVQGTIICGKVAWSASTIYAGGLAGQIESNCRLTNCHADVNISVVKGGNSVGGFVGWGARSTSIFSKCYATGNVTVDSTAASSFSWYIGGFVGYQLASANDCYATGAVAFNRTTNSPNIGGFCGISFSTAYFNRCYSVGAVTSVPATTNKGGFIGNNSGTVNYCYYDTNTSGCTDTGKGIPKTTAEMKTMTTFETWDFITPVWYMAPSKATDPTPADALVPVVKFHDLTLKWTGATGALYDVWFGPIDNILKIAAEVDEEEYVVPYTTEVIDDITHAYVDIAGTKTEITWNVPLYWGIESRGGVYPTFEPNIEDVWKFDPRPLKPTDPLPADGEVGQSLNQSLQAGTNFEHGDPTDEPDSYNLYTGTPGSVSLSLSNIEDPYLINITIPFYVFDFAWRLDPVNEFGTTEGTEWSFMTLIFVPPFGFGGVDGSGGGSGGGISGGVGDGGFATNKILVAVATNSVPGSSKVYYEK